MSTILIIVLLIVLLGGGGYYGHRSYGNAGLGGVLGLVLTIIVVLWLLGAIGGVPVVLDPGGRRAQTLTGRRHLPMQPALAHREMPPLVLPPLGHLSQPRSSRIWI